MIREIRKTECCICKIEIEFQSYTTNNKECPEMIDSIFLSFDSKFFGLIKGDSGPEIIHCCSYNCLKTLMIE